MFHNSFKIQLYSVLLLVGLLFGTTVSAQAAVEHAPETEAELEKIAQEISESTMSPFCPGRTISACPSEQARLLRLRILDWLKQGYSPQAVHNQLLTIYGDEVMGTPKAKGFGLMAWIMPSIFVVVCLLLVALMLRRSKSAIGFDSKSEVPSEEMQRRISHELESRR